MVGFILDCEWFYINRLKNKHLTEYLKSNGNNLATVLFFSVLLCFAIK